MSRRADRPRTPRPPRVRNQPLLTDAEFEAARPILLQGLRQFNEGFFFEAHETWEDLWYPSPWPARRFLQGLIQLAAAFVHLARGEYPGTIRLLDASLVKLSSFPPNYLGLEVGRLLAEARRAREELRSLGPERFAGWDRARIPRIHVRNAGA